MARGDAAEGSDVDILVAAKGGRIGSRKFSGVEIQFTPKSELLSMAARGDLFAIHLAYEAHIISDPSGFFRHFKSELRIRRNYNSEAEKALALAAYLCKRGTKPSQRAIRDKRIAWCVRTVLISRMIDDGRIIFSPQALASHFEESYLPNLIALRRQSHKKYLKSELKQFILVFGGEEFIRLSSQELKARFKEQENNVALTTLSSLRRLAFQHPYHGA